MTDLVIKRHNESDRIGKFLFETQNNVVNVSSREKLNGSKLT